jgi:hypothetical protein
VCQYRYISSKISDTDASTIYHDLVIGALVTCIDASGARSAAITLDTAQVALSAAHQGSHFLLLRFVLQQHQ